MSCRGTRRRDLLGRSGYRVPLLSAMAKDHHSEHRRSRYEQRHAANPGNVNAPARGSTFGGQFGEDMFAVITHIGIFVHLAAPDADARYLPTFSAAAELS
jgi:hypothetical protein